MAQRSSSRKPRSSGASRRGGKKSGGAPVWAWLVAGLLVGLFIAFLVYLNGVDSAGEKTAVPQAKQPSESGRDKTGHKESRRPEAHKTEVAKVETAKAEAPKTEVTEKPVPAAVAKSEPAKQENKESAPAKEAEAKTTNVAKVAPAAKLESPTKGESAPEKPALSYDFYKILPKSEVVVPEEEQRKPIAAPGTYYLQVGAFRRIEEADSRKAELAMLGIVSAIQTVTIEPGNSWHRVRIGPVKDMRQLDKAKRQLQENSISFVTLKENL